jgi:thymidylate synthase
MSKVNLVEIEARDIDEAHFKIIRELFLKGNVYEIDYGSYKGHKRLEFDHVTILINNPETRPLSPTLPVGVPATTDDESIEKYFVRYIMDTELEENETYKYSTYIAPQVPVIVESLKKYGHRTNQATISIGGPESVLQSDPPCLRIIDCRIMDNKLRFHVYFRSWDAWGGLPENLGGIQLLKELMAEQIGVEPGETIAISKGLHMYDFQWPVALKRLGNLPENSVITLADVEAGEKWMKE